MDKYIGKVILVRLPNSKMPRYRWIVRKRNDGRYIVRIPKIGLLLSELDLKREKDYGKELLLPIGSKPHNSSGTRKSKKILLKSKNKTRKQTL
jgi:hypothetical protein